MRRSNDEAAPVRRGPGQKYVLSAEGRALIDAEIGAGRVLRLPFEGGHVLFVPYGEGRAIPLSFNYERTGPGPVAWRMTVQVMDGQARCVRLLLDAPPGGFLVSDTLRLPFGRLLEEAVLLSAVELDAEGNPVGELFKNRVSSVAEARRLHARIEREHRRRARGERKVGRVSQQTYCEVADIYRQNLASGRPTKAVYEHFKETGRHISRSTAGRWVAETRDAGLLGSAPARGVPGDETSQPRSKRSTKGGTR